MTVLDTLIFLALFGTFLKLYCVDRIEGKPIVTYTDLRSRTIISLYMIGFFMSAANWVFYTIANIEDNEKALFPNIVEFVDLITVDMVFLNLQIIVFEMLSLYLTFTSTTNEENSRKQGVLRVFKWVLITLNFGSIIFSLSFLQIYRKQIKEQSIKTVS